MRFDLDERPPLFIIGRLANLRQHHMILSADTASEKCKLLSKKHREYFVLQR